MTTWVPVVLGILGAILTFGVLSWLERRRK